MAGVDSFQTKGPDSQIDEWLATEPTWTSRIGAGWEGRFLAKGGYGVVGAWTYVGPAERAPVVKDVVVKMSSFEDFAPRERIYDEGNILRTLATARSRHIVRQFGGNRSGDNFGDMLGVVKIFLEYCPGGDLMQFLREYHDDKRKPPLHEVDVWAIFYCLALAVVVMDRGTEDLTAQPWNGGAIINELCHFDIKYDNIFLSNRDADHPRIPICKIGDFGEAAWVPIAQDDAFARRSTGRGAADFRPPEEAEHIFPEAPLLAPRKGSCTNVFQIGYVMNSLLLGLEVAPNTGGAQLDHDNSNEQLRRGPNHSYGLDWDEVTDRYSRTLIELVKECVFREPRDRPIPTSLVRRALEGYHAATQAATAVPQLPEDIRSNRFVGLIQLEPPQAWLLPLQKPEDTTGGPFRARTFPL